MKATTGELERVSTFRRVRKSGGAPTSWLDAVVPKQATRRPVSVTLATWVGSIGTWAVGVLAAFIAGGQDRNGIFKPHAQVYVAPDGRTVAVRIVNRGGARRHGGPSRDHQRPRRPSSDCLELVESDGNLAE